MGNRALIRLAWSLGHIIWWLFNARQLLYSGEHLEHINIKRVLDCHYYLFFLHLPPFFLLYQRVKYVQYSQPEKLSDRDEERLNAWLNTHNRSLCSRLPELSCEESLIETKGEDEGNGVKRSVATMRLQVVIFSLWWECFNFSLSRICCQWGTT